MDTPVSPKLAARQRRWNAAFMCVAGATWLLSAALFLLEWHYDTLDMRFF